MYCRGFVLSERRRRCEQCGLEGLSPSAVLSALPRGLTLGCRGLVSVRAAASGSVTAGVVWDASFTQGMASDNPEKLQTLAAPFLR